MLGRFGSLLRAVANGPDPARIPAPTEVIPTIEVGNAPPDWDYPKGIFRYVGYCLEGAVAGQRSKVQLWNHATSGVVVVLRRILCNAAATSLVISEYVTALGSDDGAEFPMDSRSTLEVAPLKSNSAVVKSATAAGGVGTELGRIFSRANDGTNYTFDHDEPFIIFPGRSIVVYPASDNIAIQTMWYWTERAFDEKELSGVLNAQRFL